MTMITPSYLGETIEYSSLHACRSTLEDPTVGFKESRAIFENVLGSAVGTEGGIGSGVRMAKTQQIFAQGSMTNTGQPTDLALSGDGFFVVHGTVSGISGDFYTRAGQTTLRNDGTLVNPAGLTFQGYKVNPDGTTSSTVAPIQVNTAALSPKTTTKLNITANLDSTQATPATAWDPQNPGTTSNFSTSMKVYDSLGNGHNADVYFRKTAGGSWDYHVLASGSEVAGGTAGQNTEIATGTLAFSAAGALQSNTVTAGGTVSFNGAVANQAIKLDFGTPIASGGTGLDGTTQFGAPSAVSSQAQDGYSSGSLSGIKIDSTGTVQGVYTNGESIAVGKLAIAKFQSNDGLGAAGQNLWTATRDSGDVALGTAGAGGRGALVAGALENSNVDIATQFVDLIAHQRAFQANSKTITTADQMLQELMNIKQ